MKQVVTISEMRKIEEKTFDSQDITSFDLMVSVGKKMYQTFKSQHKEKNILLLCGTGNNGGDALVFGEEAFLNGKTINTIILGEEGKQSSESHKMAKRYKEHGLKLSYVTNKKEFENVINQLPNIDLIIDGIFGIGLDRDVEGFYQDVIHWINSQNKTVISLDIPSGLHGDTGQIMGVCVKANSTYTVEVMKQGLLLEDAMDVVGKVKVIDVGMARIRNHKSYVKNFHLPPKRPHNSHKYDYKSVLTIGGQVGVMGAITMASYTALIAGVGLSTLATNKAHLDHMIRPYPELMYEVIGSKEDLEKILTKKDAILFGLGMREITAFEKMVFDVITERDVPIVLDAAGMLLLKDKKSRKNKRTIITPHHGEFAKLMDVSVSELKQDPLKYLTRCIKTYDCEVVLKGSSTIYATKDEVVYLNQGTPALAKAGSGDVLAGILLTYLARDLTITQGILLHMLAAQEAVKDKHMESIIASDIIDHIPTVYNKYNKEDQS